MRSLLFKILMVVMIYVMVCVIYVLFATGTAKAEELDQTGVQVIAYEGADGFPVIYLQVPMTSGEPLTTEWYVKMCAFGVMAYQEQTKTKFTPDQADRAFVRCLIESGRAT